MRPPMELENHGLKEATRDPAEILLWWTRTGQSLRSGGVKDQPDLSHPR